MSPNLEKFSFVIGLGLIEISTHHFKGNFPSYCSLQAAYLPTIKSSKQILNSSIKWKYLLKDAKLSPNKVHVFKNNLMKKDKINFIKINIFPDGGVARLRLFGSIAKSNKLKNKKTNLASLLDGASVIACNNEHFGKAENILAPGKAKNMGDGWETRRRRGPGFDWLILNSLDGKEIDKIEISTHHFKGNFPSHCSLQAAYLPTIKNSKQIVNSSIEWKHLLKDAKLSSNKVHIFKNILMKKDKINFIKISIFPDGGISRFRIYGKNV